MITKFLNKVSVVVATLMLVAVPTLMPVAVVSAATPDINSSLCNGASLSVTGSGDCSSDGTDATAKVNSVIATVINMLTILVGVAAVIMIMWGGMRYVTSGGDSGKVTTAKNTIIYAIIGLVVVALSQFIVRFVLSKLTS